MKFRYTIEDLKRSDMWLLLRVVHDRKSTCTNVYSPLYKRLSKIENKIQNKEKLTDKLIKGAWNEEEEVGQ